MEPGQESFGVLNTRCGHRRSLRRNWGATGSKGERERRRERQKKIGRERDHFSTISLVLKDGRNWIMSWVFLLLRNFLQHSSHTVCLQQTRRTCPLHTSYCTSESPGRQRPWGKLVGSRAKQISFEFLVPLPKRLVLSDVYFVPFLERKVFPIGKHLYSHPWLPMI